jgi:hypothetical protein
MTEAWVKLVTFLVTQFGPVGSMAVALCCYLIYRLNEEQRKVDTLQDKRLELHTQYLTAVNGLKDSIQAIQAILGKEK